MDRHPCKMTLALVATLWCLGCPLGCQEQMATGPTGVPATDASFHPAAGPHVDRQVVPAGHLFSAPPLPSAVPPTDVWIQDTVAPVEPLIRVAPEIGNKQSRHSQPRRLPPIHATHLSSGETVPPPAAAQLPPPPVAAEDDGRGDTGQSSAPALRRLPPVVQQDRGRPANVVGPPTDPLGGSVPPEVPVPADQGPRLEPVDASASPDTPAPQVVDVQPEQPLSPAQSPADDDIADPPRIAAPDLPADEPTLSQGPERAFSLSAPEFDSEAGTLERAQPNHGQEAIPAPAESTTAPMDLVPPAPRRELPDWPSNVPVQPIPVEPNVADVQGGRQDERWLPVQVPVQPRTSAAEPVTPDTSPVVTRQVLAIVQQANRLASRGALFAARAELIKAIRVATQACDTQQGVNKNSEALSRAMRALEEADDFAPRGSRLEAEIDLELVVTAHRTPVLKEEQLVDYTPLAALQRYFTYAQQQLAEACAAVPATAEALYGLGRIYTVLDESSATSQELNVPRAMALHQAALIVQPRHHKAANELGVLLARYGQLEDARRVLLHSIMLQPAPETWHNLAVVHERLGEVDLAQRARHEWQLARDQRRNRPQPGQTGPVRWVDVQEFTAARPNAAP